jgi:glycine/D-amino acid oxidase-like deaminating enzyme
MIKDPEQSCDVAIVGGGIIGSATAWALAQKGVRVTVFERGRIASEQSSRAWGFIRQQGRHEAEVPLAAEANGMWVELTREFGTDATAFTPGGILVPAETDEDEDRVASGLEVARRFGLDTRMLKRAEVRELIPELAGNWQSGLYTAGDAHGDPARSTETIARAARAAGVTFRENCPVLEVDVQAGAVSGVVTAQGRCTAPVVLLANAIGAPVLADGLGIELPIQIIKSSVGLTAPATPFTKVAMWGPKVAYRPHGDGRFTLGNGYRGMGADYELTIDSFRSLHHFLPAYRRNWRLMKLGVGRDFLHQLRARASRAAAVRQLPEPVPNQHKIDRNLASFREMFPHLGPIGLERSWAGRIDLTPDVIPILDQPRMFPGLFVAAGFCGHGFALGPSIGRQMAQWIHGGRPSIDLDAFRLGRFWDGGAQHAKQAL